MAAFLDDPTERERLDWRLLLDGHLVLYHRAAVLANDLAWFADAGYVIHRLACGAWRSVDDLHADVARTLGFPDYYGRNLDAFNDCVGDLPVPVDAGGMVLVCTGFDAFLGRERRIAIAMLDILAVQGRCYLMTGQRFLVLLQSDDPTLAFDPVGAQHVTWNPREWLDADRLPGGGS